MNHTEPSFQPSSASKDYSPSALDKHPYSCIKLNKSGRVLEFNLAASEMMRVRVADALGKCFFTQVAPCAESAAFHGRFKVAMAGNGVINKVLDHRFLFSNAPHPIRTMNVRVHMFSSVDADGLPIVWILAREKVGGSIHALQASNGYAPRGVEGENALTAFGGLKTISRPRIQNISSQFGVSI